MAEPWNERSPFDPSNPLSGILDSPEMRRQRLWDTLGNLSVALIQAGAPSRVPNSFIGALGAGLAGNTSGGEDRLMRRAMLGMQAAKTQAELDRKKSWAKMFEGGAAPDAAPAPPPGEGGTAPAPAPNQAEFIRMMTPHALAVSQATGVDPRLVLAQSALETGWGTAAPGNNFFGIKSHGRAGGQDLATNEVGAGGLYRTTDSFRTYASPAQSAQDYAEFLKTNSRYAPVLQAQGLDAQIDAMGKSGYATDPNYAVKLRQIAQGLPPVAGPQVAQGDGNVVPAQYNPQAPQQPRDLRQVIQSLPPGMRQIIGTMDPDAGVQMLVKYGFMTPAEQERLRMDAEGLRLRQTSENRDERKFSYQQEQDRLKRQEDARKGEREAGQQTFSNEKALRNEFETQPAVKSYRTVVPMLESAKDAASRPTRAADLNLVYAFAKLMDPDSVVRESETGAVVATASVADRLAAYIGQLNGQPMLNADMRAKLLRELDSRAEALKSSHDALASKYEEIAKAYNIEPGRVVIPIRQGTKSPSDGGLQPTQDELQKWAPRPAPVRIGLDGKPK